MRGNCNRENCGFSHGNSGGGYGGGRGGGGGYGGGGGGGGGGYGGGGGRSDICYDFQKETAPGSLPIFPTSAAAAAATEAAAITTEAAPAMRPGGAATTTGAEAATTTRRDSLPRPRRARGGYGGGRDRRDLPGWRRPTRAVLKRVHTDSPPSRANGTGRGDGVLGFE